MTSTHDNDKAREAAGREMPTLPKSLLNLIGEYGMARTDGVNDLEIQHRWLMLIAGIKEYARSVLTASEAKTAVPEGWISTEDRMPEAGQSIVKKWKSGAMWAGKYTGSAKHSSFDYWKLI